jgi:hypothetical protein
MLTSLVCYYYYIDESGKSTVETKNTQTVGSVAYSSSSPSITHSKTYGISIVSAIRIPGPSTAAVPATDRHHSIDSFLAVMRRLYLH